METAAALDALVEKFLALYVDAFGWEWLTPKFHWLLHFGDHYKKHHMLPNCFVLEGRHRIPNKYAEDLQNISRAATESLIMEVNSHHLALLTMPTAFNLDVGLIGGKPPSKRVLKELSEMLEVEDHGDIQIALLARFSQYGICKKNDVVLLREADDSYTAGQILLLASVAGVCIMMGETWTLKSSHLQAGYSKWSTKETSRMLAPLGYFGHSDPHKSKRLTSGDCVAPTRI